MKRILGVLVAVLLVVPALLSTGCGGDSAVDDKNATELTPEQKAAADGPRSGKLGGRRRAAAEGDTEARHPKEE